MTGQDDQGSGIILEMPVFWATGYAIADQEAQELVISLPCRPAGTPGESSKSFD